MKCGHVAFAIIFFIPNFAIIGSEPPKPPQPTVEISALASTLADRLAQLNPVSSKKTVDEKSEVLDTYPKEQLVSPAMGPLPKKLKPSPLSTTPPIGSDSPFALLTRDKSEEVSRPESSSSSSSDEGPSDGEDDTPQE
jgi:hypothetical protein